MAAGAAVAVVVVATGGDGAGAGGDGAGTEKLGAVEDGAEAGLSAWEVALPKSVWIFECQFRPNLNLHARQACKRILY